MNKLHYIIVLIVVLAIATLTYKLSTSVDETADITDARLRHTPDYFISDFRATMYDKSGTASYRLAAQHLEHFPSDDRIEVQQPRVEYIDKYGQVWLATAASGTGYKETEILQLSGNVKIIRNNPDPDKNLLLESDNLTISFTKKQASTDSRVKISGKNSTISSTGMDINLESGVLILKSQARGQYVP